MNKVFVFWLMCYHAALVGCQVIIAAAFLLRVGKSLAVGWLLMLRIEAWMILKIRLALKNAVKENALRLIYKIFQELKNIHKSFTLKYTINTIH